MYITKLLVAYIIYNKCHALNEVILFDIYIFEDSFDLENLPLLNIELTLILQFYFLDDLLKLSFLTRCLSIYWWKERGTKVNLSNILKDVTDEKSLEIHKNSWLSMVWIYKKLNSFKSNYLINYLQSKTTFWAKLTKNQIR